VPLVVSARGRTRAKSAVQGAVGIITMAIGVMTIVATVSA